MNTLTNTNIEAGELVPKEIRLEVYRKTLKLVQTNDNMNYANTYGVGVCLVLPVVLWNLDNYLRPQPNGNTWSYGKTARMFPELQSWIKKIEAKDSEKSKQKVRILFLQDAIKSLESSN